MNAREVRRAARDRVAEEIVVLLAGRLPGSDPRRIAEVVARLPLNVEKAESLLEHLRGNEDALTSGRSDGPASLGRLVRLLAADHPGVEPVRCVDCDRPGRLEYLVEGGRVCVVCQLHRHPKVCNRCGRSSVSARRDGDGYICSRCANQAKIGWQDCSGCGQHARVAYRVEGRPLCQCCGPRKLYTCTSCGRGDQAAHAFTDTGPICGACYHRRRQRECESCGRCDHTVFRRAGQSRLLCAPCWTPPLASCLVCGETRPIRKGLVSGRPICESCRSSYRTRRPCSLCRVDKRIHSNLPLGSVCGPCYDAVRRNPASCANCEATRPLIGRRPDGSRICGPCAGDTREWICRNCGEFAALFADGTCEACMASQRLRSLLSGPDGRVRAQLVPLIEFLETDEPPRRIINWLNSSAWMRLLGTLAAEHEQITHELLDEQPGRWHVQYLRQVLVHARILSERDEDLERIAPWLDELLRGQPADVAALLRPYTHWWILRRARFRARAAPSTRGTRKHARSRILIAVAFLTWIAAQDLPLAEVRQHHIDAWLAQGTTTHYKLRDFLKWAHARGLAADLFIPALGRRADPGEILPDEDRWQVLDRCLNADDTALTVRAAGALLVLFGQIPSRVVRLTHDDLTFDGERTYLSFDQHPVLLPPRVAYLMHQLADTEPLGRYALMQHSQAPQHWLFPGATPGCHADGSRLAHLVKQKLGVAVRPARNAALCALAADLPASVLAALLGFSITTAERWTTLIKRDWSAYLQARTEATAGPRSSSPSTGSTSA